jgi:hypothetical protein
MILPLVGFELASPACSQAAGVTRTRSRQAPALSRRHAVLSGWCHSFPSLLHCLAAYLPHLSPSPTAFPHLIFHSSPFHLILLELVNMKSALVLAASTGLAAAGMHRMPLKKVSLDEQLVGPHYIYP